MMYYTPEENYKKNSLLSTLNESIYLTPCYTSLSETPKIKHKKRCRSNSLDTKTEFPKNSNTLLKSLNEEVTYYSSYKSPFNEKNNNQLFFHGIDDKENENYNNSIYFTPVSKLEKQSRTPLTEIKSSLLNSHWKCDSIHQYNAKNINLSNTQAKKYNIDYNYSVLHNENDMQKKPKALPDNYEDLKTPKSYTKFCYNNENTNKQICHSSEPCNSEESTNFRERYTSKSNIENSSNISVKSIKRISSKFSSSKPVRRIKDRTLLQKILKLKLLRRIPPTLPLHISFVRPYDLVSGFTTTYSKKLNIFRKLFGRHKVQDKYYTKLRNRPSTSSLSSNNTNSNRCLNCCHSTQSQILASIKDISDRLGCIENDMKDLRNLLNHQKSGEIINTCDSNDTATPPLPPPLPPFPLFVVSALKKCNESTNGFTSALAANAQNTGVNKSIKTKKTFTITADDIRSVKLKKTPVTSLEKGKKPLSCFDPRFPAISVDMLRSVKLKPSKTRRITDKKRRSMSPYFSRESSGNSPNYIGKKLTFCKENCRIAVNLNNSPKSIIFEMEDKSSNKFCVNESDC